MGEPPLFGVWNLLCVAFVGVQNVRPFPCTRKRRYFEFNFRSEMFALEDNFWSENEVKREDATLLKENKVKTDRFFENLN